jgi:CheY-like chemotaxis protein
MSGRVLVVNGGGRHRRETREVLEHAGYEVTATESPEEAAEMSKDTPLPVAVVVECIRESGLPLEVANRLREHAATAQMPLLVLAEEASAEAEAELSALVPSVWVPEPCSPQHLLEELQFLTGRVPPKMKAAGEKGLKPPFSPADEA